MEIVNTEAVLLSGEAQQAFLKAEVSRNRADSASVTPAPAQEVTAAESPPLTDQVSITHNNPSAATPLVKPVADQVNATTFEGLDPEIPKPPPQSSGESEKTVNEKTSASPSPGRESESVSPQTMANSRIQFKIVDSEDPVTGEVSRQLIVLLIDKDTGDLIRTIPPEEFESQFEDLSKPGLFIDRFV